MKAPDHDWIDLTLIVVEIVDGSDSRLGLGRVFGNPVNLVLVLYRGGQVRSLVDDTL